jgi:hypothetical protein
LTSVAQNDVFAYPFSYQPARNVDDGKALAFVPPSGGLSFIEQLQKASLKPCSNQPPRWCLGTDPETKTCLVTRPACKCWSCPECAARNARQWIARILNGVNHLDGDWFMFTLTAHANCRGTAHSVDNLRQGWKKLYNRARYEFGTSHYVRVWELHADGATFHLHGLVDTNWGQRWLKDNSAQCGMGYQVDIHEVDNAGQVAGYIAKYFLKSESVRGEHPAAWPKSLRRIEVSRQWPELPELAEFSRFSWQVFDTSEGVQNFAEFKRHQGYKIVDLTA